MRILEISSIRYVIRRIFGSLEIVIVFSCHTFFCNISAKTFVYNILQHFVYIFGCVFNFAKFCLFSLCSCNKNKNNNKNSNKYKQKRKCNKRKCKYASIGIFHWLPDAIR